jgi:pilus assembly protein Flp/PilA
MRVPMRGAMEPKARNNMNRTLRHLAALHQEETGQDLIEYALVMALIALAAAVGMRGLASSINAAFSKMGNILTQYT